MRTSRQGLAFLPALLLFSLVAPAQDFSNKGKDFWVVYSGHIDGTTSRMALYITSDQAASGNVDVNGSLIPFTVTANQVTTVRLTNTSNPSNTSVYNGQIEGIGSKKGIHITSDNPVVVYAHILNAARSGSTLVLPANVLGKEYYVATYKSAGNQSPRYCQFEVVATEDHTVIEVTPTNADAAGIHQANQSFTVVLSKGDVYQYQSLEDLTGSHIKSIGTSGTSCQPIAVYSGSTWTAMGCVNANSGDNLYQQIFPFASWGKTYYTAPFKNRAFDVFRIIVQDPAEPVYVNGSPLDPATLVNNRFYEFNSNKPIVITSNKPVSVFQYMITQNCDNSSESDPEMVILNSVEQTLNDITVMSARRDLTPPNTNITSHFLNIIFKTNTLASLKIDGNPPSSTPIVIPGTNYSYLQEDVTSSTASNPSHRVISDSGFICIAYGYGNVESYGYNAGTNVKDLYQYVSIQNQYATVNFPGTCNNSPFSLSMTFPYHPTEIKWMFNGLFPDTAITNPQADSTWTVNGKQLYLYKLTKIYSIPASGTYPIKVLSGLPSAEGCGGDQEIDYDLKVYERPHADFNFTTLGCAPDSVRFQESANTNGRPAVQWSWNFGDGKTDVSRNPVHLFSGYGNFQTAYAVITDIGCVSDTARKTVSLGARPQAAFSISSPACAGKNLTLSDVSTVAQGNIVQWNWDLGDGTRISNSLGTAIAHDFTASGSYSIHLVVKTEKGCIDSSNQSLSVHALPVAGFILPDNCVEDLFSQFIDSSKISDGTQGQFSYLWDFGDPNSGPGNLNISTLKNPKHKYSAVGPYTIHQTVTSVNGCAASATSQFIVNSSQPVTMFSVDGNSFCSNDSLRITNQATIDVGRIVKMEIYWDYANDPSNKSTILYPVTGSHYGHKYPVFYTPSTKSYTIRIVTYSGDVCFNQFSRSVELKASPEIDFLPLPGVCADAPAFQINQASVVNGMEGTPSFSGAGISASGSFDPSLAGAGPHVLRFDFSASNGCSAYAEQNIQVFTVPIVNAGPDRAVLEGGSIVLLASSSGNNLNYSWTPALGLSNANTLQPQSQPTEDINYTLKVTSADGCSASDQVTVKVLKAPSVPNVFTPNGDGINDRWEIKYLESYPGCKVQIFNSYGQLIFESTGYTKPWDGTFKGSPVPAGTYYYIINPKNGRKQMSGFVDVIR